MQNTENKDINSLKLYKINSFFDFSITEKERQDYEKIWRI